MICKKKKCRGIKSLRVPSGVLQLEQFALMFTPTLEKLTLPSTIEHIENYSIPLSDPSFAPKLHDITFQWGDKEQTVHSDIGFENIHKTKNGEFICQTTENNYIVATKDEIKIVSQIDASQITDRLDFSSRYEKNSYAKGKPNVDISKLDENERQLAIREFSEDLPSLENLLSSFAQRGLTSTGACAGHDTNGGYFSFSKNNIPCEIQKAIIKEAKKSGAKVRESDNDLYIDIPFFEHDKCFDVISSQVRLLPLQQQETSKIISDTSQKVLPSKVVNQEIELLKTAKLDLLEVQKRMELEQQNQMADNDSNFYEEQSNKRRM